MGLLVDVILKPGHMALHLLTLVFATTFIMVCLMPALSELLFFFFFHGKIHSLLEEKAKVEV